MIAWNSVMIAPGLSARHAKITDHALTASAKFVKSVYLSAKDVLMISAVVALSLAKTVTKRRFAKTV